MKPGQIFNVDKTGMPLKHQSSRVLARKGQKKVRYCTSGNKSQVTVVDCINAIGQALPPFVIFSAKNLNLDWRFRELCMVLVRIDGLIWYFLKSGFLPFLK